MHLSFCGKPLAYTTGRGLAERNPEGLRISGVRLPHFRMALLFCDCLHRLDLRDNFKG